MIRSHVSAVLARLREDTILAAATFDGQVTGRPARYCVVFPDSGARSSERLTGLQSRTDFEFTIHSVGTTREQAQLVAERVFAQLWNWRPVVASRSCWPMTCEASQPVRTDDDVTPPIFYSVDVFRLSSTPA